MLTWMNMIANRIELSTRQQQQQQQQKLNKIATSEIKVRVNTYNVYTR